MAKVKTVKDVWILRLICDDRWMPAPVHLIGATLTDKTITTAAGRRFYIGSGVLVFDTFKAAKAELVRRKRWVVSSLRADIERVRRNLAEVRALTAESCKVEGGK